MSRIRTNLSERASDELLAIMEHYNFTSTNHSLNVIVGQLFKSLNLSLAKEGKIDEQRSKH